MAKKIKQEDVDSDADSYYCTDCGGCGYIDCDGVRMFLEKHVKGKTTCPVEASFIRDIIDRIENNDKD